LVKAEDRKICGCLAKIGFLRIGKAAEVTGGSLGTARREEVGRFGRGKGQGRRDLNGRGKRSEQTLVGAGSRFRRKYSLGVKAAFSTGENCGLGKERERRFIGEGA